MATREQLQEWGRRGGKARAAMPDFVEHQRRAGRRSAEVNDMAALGHRGAMAFIRKYGYVRLFELARKWRLRNPSRHERRVMAILEDLGVQYEREARVLGERELVSVDFYLPGRGKIVEVNGRVHYDPAFDHPNYPGTRARKEAERLSQLREAFEVLVLDYREMADAPSRIVEFLGEAV
jgi:hypothetical protein